MEKIGRALRPRWPDDGVCDFALDPGEPVPRDRPIWRIDEDPYIVLIGQQPCGFEHAMPIDAAELPTSIRRFTSDDGEYLVLGGGNSTVRLRFEPDLLRHGAILLPRERYSTIRAQTAQWFMKRLAGRGIEPSPEAARLTPFRRRRLMTLLQAHDMRTAGCSSRMIAGRLIDPELEVLPAVDWGDRKERRQIRRWIAEAAKLVHGGYRDLLHGS